MNILFICDEYPPGKNGGIGTMVHVLSGELVRQGHKVFVAGLYAHNYGQKNYEEDFGVKVWRFRYGWNLRVQEKNIFYKLFNKIPGILKQHFNGLSAFKRFTVFIDSLIEKEKIEIIEIPDWNTFSMRMGFLVKWPRFKVPLVLKSHGSYTYFENEMGRTGKKKLLAIDQELYKRADALCAVSSYTANKNKKLFGITKEIKVLYNAMESYNIPLIKKSQDKVIFTGTLIEKKGIFQLIKAWNIVNKKNPSIKLFIFGKGNTIPLKKLLTEQALTTVYFEGHVTRKKVLSELANATLAVFPSYSEAFGLAVLEAMNVGCPVIYTKRASGSEIISNKVNGELVDPDDINDIAESIIRIINDLDLQADYSLIGKQTIESKFNILNSAMEHVAFYTQTIIEFNQNSHLI